MRSPRSVRVCTSSSPGFTRALLSVLRAYFAAHTPRISVGVAHRVLLLCLILLLSSPPLLSFFLLRRYAPLGWTKKYEFSSADRDCALRIVDDLINDVAKGRAHIDPAAVPWKALRTSLGQSIYGGRIDNPFDDVLLNSLLDQLFVPESFDIDFPLVMCVHSLSPDILCCPFPPTR